MAPIVVPVHLSSYPHFVVFRGALGNRVLLADPGFGPGIYDREGVTLGQS